jgi:rare lipoprotein A
MYDMTAAHRTLPLQSLVRVVSQRTGESIVVRINDRGPYVGGRIIDLSWRARERLGMAGIAAVFIEVLEPFPPPGVCGH